jgi:hypothetical protein
MRDRISLEVEVLRLRYPDAKTDSGSTYVLVHEIDLPAGWNRARTDVLVLVPPGYPVTPPDNFFVPEGLRLTNGQIPTNYSEGASMLNQIWGQFSFHSQEWRPSSQPCEGDSLVTYFALVEKRLAEVN